MTQTKKTELLRLINFIDMAYRDKDINEQLRDWKKDNVRNGGNRYGQIKN